MLNLTKVPGGTAGGSIWPPEGGAAMDVAVLVYMILFMVSCTGYITAIKKK